jgi:hypothetical protein
MSDFRDFVRATMKGLVGQKPSDMRRPGRGKGPKIRTALNAIGPLGWIFTRLGSPQVT